MKTQQVRLRLNSGRLTLAALCLTLALAACSGQGRLALTSTAAPGDAVISFPNSFDQNWMTVLLSKPDTTQAGVDGRVLTVRVFDRQQPIADELTLDMNGNLGLRGNLFSRSSRSDKKKILPYRGDALGLLRAVRVVTYLYKNEGASSSRHIGFIAEDAPVDLTGPYRTSINLNNSVAVTIAATQELENQVLVMRTEIAALKRELAAKKARLP